MPPLYVSVIGASHCTALFQDSRLSRVVIPLYRQLVGFAKVRLFAQIAGFRKLKIDHKSIKRFSTGVPVNAIRESPLSFKMVLVCAALGFLMFALVQNNSTPVRRTQ